MKVLITGAHFTPAQAVMEELSEITDIKLVYLGKKFTIYDDKTASAESKTLPKLRVKFIPIIAGKLNRFFSFQSVIYLLLTPIGFLQSFYYLLKEKPDLIVSFGGFTGLPVVLSGWLLSIPSIIHEQGLKMGLANFISSFFATKIAVSFKDFKAPSIINPNKIVVTGNPIRQEFFDKNLSPKKEIENFIIRAKSRRKPIILVTGGNQGSHKINLIIEDKLTDLLEIAAIIHQTGDSKYDDFSNLKKSESEDYLVFKWIDAKDLSYILEKIDLVISRAGINTLIELGLKSSPSLMIPISFSNEQKENAMYFSKLGLGEVLDEKKLTPDSFLVKVRELLRKRLSLKISAKKVQKEILLKAEKRIVQEVSILENNQEKQSLGY